MRNAIRLRTWLVVSLLLSLPTIGTARVRPGVEVGLNVSSLSYENDDQFPFQYWDRQWRTGLAAGVTLEVPFRERLGLLTGLRYVQHGNRVHLDTGGSIPFVGDVQFVHNYLSLPVVLAVRPLPSPRIVFSLGPEVAFLLSGRLISEITLPQEDTGYADIGKDMDPTDVSLRAGTSFEFPIENHVGSVNLRYSHGFTGVAKESRWASDWKTRGIEAVVGMKW